MRKSFEMQLPKQRECPKSTTPPIGFFVPPAVNAIHLFPYFTPCALVRVAPPLSPLHPHSLASLHNNTQARHFDFFPATFVLPGEYGLFLEEFKRTPGQSWIMKPVGKAQGKGIFLFNKLSQISEWKKDHKVRRLRHSHPTQHCAFTTVHLLSPSHNAVYHNPRV